MISLLEFKIVLEFFRIPPCELWWKIYALFSHGREQRDRKDILWVASEF
jgi:hypothetical protein